MNEKAEKRVVVAISGPVSVGKTTLCASLAKEYGFAWVKTRNLVRAITGADLERKALQEAGAALEIRTKGNWISDHINNDPQLRKEKRILVDSVRLKAQIDALRRTFGNAVVHIHLTATVATLNHRYRGRKTELKELSSYAEVGEHKTESQIAELEKAADIVVRTENADANQVFNRVSEQLMAHLNEQLN